MFIFTIPTEPIGTNTYVIGCQETLEAAVIDPGWNSLPAIESYLSKNTLTLKKVLLTHSHWDHIGNVAEVKEKYNTPIYVHQNDAGNVLKPGSDGLRLMIPIKAATPDFYLNENEIIEVGNLKFKIIHTPGHSPGCVCFYNQNENTLFSGDTLFKGSIGNISLPTSNPPDMWPSLKKLERLPPDTIVYPGHGEKTTIGSESWLPKAQQVFGH